MEDILLPSGEDTDSAKKSVLFKFTCRQCHSALNASSFGVVLFELDS